MLVSAGISDHDLNFTFERKGSFPYWTYALFHKGEAFIKSNRKDVKACPYDLICIRPNTPYATRIVPGYSSWQGDWLIGSLRSEWEELIKWKEVLPGIYSVNIAGTADQEKIKKYFRDTVNFVLSIHPFADISAMHALEEVLLLTSKINDQQLELNDKRILMAIEILSNNFKKFMDIESVSKEVGMSPSRLAHLFKEEVGETPMNFREGIRLKHAKQLIIGTNMSIKEIAEAVAYDCAFHFSKRFKVRIGVSPNKFRQQISEPNFLENN
jgi:AraC family transcriptional regulator of arabinose operon